MPWDDDNQGGNGPWGSAPKGNGSGKRPNQNQPDDIDEIIRKSQEKIKDIFSNGKKGSGKSGGSGGSGVPASSGSIFAMIAIIISLLWLASGVYTVDTKEAGVVLQFGKYKETTSPGINYHLPYPIERVIKLKVTDRYRTEIGGGTSSLERSSFRRNASRESQREILMLTGDENIVDVNFEVQWQIDNPEHYLFNVYDPQSTVRDAAESAMREVIGTTPLSDILSEGRTVVQLHTKELLQSVLDSYKAGIKIEEINMRGVPPKNSIRVESITTDEEGNMRNEMITTTVDEAFKDVQAAIINKEETINSAIARSNELIPQARGHAQRLLQQAQGYKEQVIAKAEGEAKRFMSVYNEYRNAKTVTKKRMYLETMEETLNGTDLIILDSSAAGGAVPYLPLNELNKRRTN